MPRPRKGQAAVLTPGEMLKAVSHGLSDVSYSPNFYTYKPHFKQYKFHTSTKKIKLYIGGNRSGKTVGGAVELCWWLTHKHPYRETPREPIRARAVAVDFLYGVDKIMLPQIKQWLPPSFLIDGSWEKSYNNQLRTLTLANDSFVEFKSYEQDLEKFAGTSRHITWYDEEPPRHVFNECQARLVDTNGDAWITMTPVEGMSWVYDEIYLPGTTGENSRYEIIEIEMTENPYIGKDAAESYLSMLDPEERKARERGEFVALGGKIFKGFNNHDHVIPFELPPKDWQWYVSIDHGYNNPTAILWHAVSPDNHIVTFSEHYASEMTVEQHAQVYHMRNAGFERQPDVTVGDPAMAQRSGITGTSILQEYAMRGVYIGTERSDVDSGLNRMIQYLKVRGSTNKPSWQITENCTNLISEMKKYRWATYSSRKHQYEKNKQETPHKKDDHAIDSTRYMFTTQPDLGPMELGSGSPMSEEGRPQLVAATMVPVAGTFDQVYAKNEWSVITSASQDDTLDGYEYD